MMLEPINVNGKPTGYTLRVIAPHLLYGVHVSIIHEAVGGSIVQAVGEGKENTIAFLWRIVQLEADRVRKSKLPVDNAEHILALEALLHERQRQDATLARLNAFVAEGYRKMAQCGWWRHLFREHGQCELLMMHAAIGGVSPCFELPSTRCVVSVEPRTCPSFAA